MIFLSGRRALLLAAISLFANACGGADDGDAPDYQIETDTSIVRDPTMVQDEQRIEVTLDDFVIEMPDTIPSGLLVFEVTNRGTNEHSFEVEGQGVHQALSAPANPGDSMELTVELDPGTYRIYCPVEGHAERGMETSVLVQ